MTEAVGIRRGVAASSTLLGLAIALTSATQLRAPGLPIGPGEVLLASWIVVTIFGLLRRGRVVVSPTARGFLAFWGFTLGTLCLGWIVGLYQNVWDPASIRDAIAFALAAVATSLLLLLPAHEARLGRALAVLLPTIALTMSALLLATLRGRIQFGPVNTLYYGLRFSGWALNPNQLALMVLMLPFLAAEGWSRAREGGGRAWNALLGAAAIGVGVGTLSDALFLAWAWALAALGAWWWVRVVRRPSRRYLDRVAAVFLVPLALLVGATAAGPSVMRVVDRVAEAGYGEGGQGSDRVARWEHGLQAAERSPVVGLGPGSYSGPFAAFQGEEAHNTFIDWLDVTGLVGALALLVLWVWVGWRALRAGDVLRAVALSSLIVFAMFHFVLRQPVFWFYVVAVATARPATRPAAPAPEAHA